MPVNLFTGTGGSSKTLNAVRMINEDPNLKNRPVYYFNMQDVAFDWIELSEEEARKWYELPIGSIILFDEGQKLFRPRPKSSTDIPLYITEFETNRHSGYDIIVTSQHPMLLDIAFRRQVTHHYHFERAFGFESARRLFWNKCINDPDDYHARKDATVEKVKFPKKYYGTYKSTELNTYKRQIPKKLYFVAASILLVAAGAVHFAMRLTDRYAVDDQAVSSSAGAEVVGVPAKPEHSFKPVYPTDPAEYLELFKPRIQGLAHTAPVYDELTKPQRAPKTICTRIHRSTGSQCSCFTEQGTRLSVPLNRCNDIVDNGLYDPTIPPSDSGGSGVDRYQRSAASSPSVSSRSDPERSARSSGLVLPGVVLPSDKQLPDYVISGTGSLRTPDRSTIDNDVYRRVNPIDLPPVKVTL